MFCTLLQENCTSEEFYYPTVKQKLWVDLIQLADC